MSSPLMGEDEGEGEASCRALSRVIAWAMYKKRQAATWLPVFWLAVGMRVRDAGLWITENPRSAATAVNAQTVSDHVPPECLIDRTTRLPLFLSKKDADEPMTLAGGPSKASD